MLKPVSLLVVSALLGACASQPAPSDNWTRWVCDSQAEVLWRFADSSLESVDVRLGGGDIVYRGFDKGKVYLQMQGACAGCPSSSATLKAGVEQMMRHYVPEVTRVEQTL